MTKSKWSPRTVAGFRVRPQVRNGHKTGNWFVDVPKSSSYGRRRRVLFETVNQAETFAVDLAAKLATINTRHAQAGNVLYNSLMSGMPMPIPMAPAMPVQMSAPPAGPGPTRPTFGAAVELWKRSSKDKIAVGKKREASHATDLARLKPLLDAFANHQLPQINELNWGAYLRQCMEKDGYAPNTVQGEATVMRKVLNFSERIFDWYRAPKLPGVGIEEDDERRLTEAELTSVIQVMERPYFGMFWLFAETGLRKSEVLTLTWPQIDLERSTVEVRKTRRGKPKSRPSIRRVLFSQGLHDELLAMRRAREAFETISDDSLVFPAAEKEIPKDGGPPKDKPLANLKRAFVRAAKRMKWEGEQIPLSPQRLRRAYITALANRGVDDFIVKRVAGHSPTSDVTNKHYARLNDEGLRKALLELPVGGNANGNAVATRVATRGNRPQKGR